MSNEEFEKKMEFILEQQAQFAANIQAHDERFAQLENVVNRLAAVTLEGFKDVNAKIDALVDAHTRLEETEKQLSESHARLADAQARTAEAQKRTEEAFARLTEAQARTEENQARLSANQALTDEALRRLITTVERHISEGRNGGQKSDE